MISAKKCAKILFIVKTEKFNFRLPHRTLPVPVLSELDEVANHEKFVLVLITGGTLCMKRNEKGNYAPVEGFLSDAIPGIRNDVENF